MEIFAKLLVPFDWSAIEGGGASEEANALNSILQDFIEQSFPLKTRTLRSTDAPWLTPWAKRLITRRKRINKAEGKSQR